MGIVAAFVALAASPALASSDLVLIPDGQMLLILIVFFVALIFPVNALIFKPIFAALDERQEKVAGFRRRSQSLQAGADSVLKRYRDSIREVRAEVDQARREQLDAVRTEQATITAEARSSAEGQLAAARTELEAALVAARQTLRTNAQDLARDAATAILGRSL